MPCYTEQNIISKAVFDFKLTWKGEKASIRLHPAEGANLNNLANCQSVNLYGHRGSRFVN
jgi:hypothetical protein